MNSQALKSLTIKHLRGSVEPFTLEFEKGKKLTIIYGENGAGKSTICDALEFLGQGKVGSIEGRGLKKSPSYWASLGRSSEDIFVGLEMADRSCHAQMNKSKVVVDPPDSRPKIEVLRRSQILGLIEASPSERYKAIARFIDVSGIEESEQTLGKLVKDLKKDSERAIALTNESRSAIEAHYQASKVQSKDVLAWVKAEVARDFGSLGQETKISERLKTRYSALAPRIESVKQAFSEEQIAEQELATAQEQFDAIAARASQESAELLALWKTAQRFFHDHSSVSACPLCESTDNADGLASRIEQKIGQLSQLNQAAERRGRSQTKLLQAQQKFQLTKEEIKSAVDRFQMVAIDEALPRDTPLPTEPLPREVAKLSEWLGSTKSLPDKWEEMKVLRQEKKQLAAALKQLLKNYEENVQQHQALATLIPKLEQALQISEEERKAFTDELLTQIADEVGRLYEKIHPGEGKDKISLELDPKRRASLEISSDFCGECNVPPQAYFSESHLDTLGLCVFLALSGLDSPEDTILVLDDVLASVDEPHVDRLMHLLHDETHRFRHCLITTHYRPWKYKLRWGWLKDKQCHFVELTNWSEIKGLTLIRSIPEVERLRDLLSCEQPDVQGICSKSGVILEAVLDFLTRLYECKVPRRPDERYTLGDLLPALDKKLKKALRVERLDGEDADGNPTYTSRDLQSLIDEIHRIAQVRNVCGAHFNTMSFDLLEGEALNFGRAVMELADILIDPDNGWPKSDKSGSYWATSGDTRRLHPLKRPG